MKKFLCAVLIASSVTLLGFAHNAYSISSNNTASAPCETLETSQSNLNLASSQDVTDSKIQVSEESITPSTEDSSQTKNIESLNKVSSRKAETTDSNKKVTSNENKPSSTVENTNNNSSIDKSKTVSADTDTVAKPSEDELMNLVLNGEYALKNIFKGTAYHSKNIIIQNNYCYGEVTNFKSREEMKESLAPYFADSVIENILNQYLINHNGKLYFTIGDAGLRVNYNTCKKEFSYENNKITIKLTEIYNNKEMFSEIKTLELINGKWIFTDFWYV